MLYKGSIDLVHVLNSVFMFSFYLIGSDEDDSIDDDDDESKYLKIKTTQSSTVRDLDLY